MTALAPTVTAGVLARLAELDDELITIRRDLHAHPELSGHERRTAALVRARLLEAGLTVQAGPVTSMVVDLGATDPIRRVALRADLDALPVTERTGLSYASSVPGVTHACGHDVHTTALLGAGLALADAQPALREAGLGVRLIFQHSEEVLPGGAHDLLAAGVLDDVDRVFAVHCDPALDVGEVGLRVGPLTAATDRVEVELTGRGGHTSRPHLTQDLTYALASVVTQVPAAMSRRVDPRAGSSLVWGRIEAGDAANVIPSHGIAEGTIRVLDAEVWSSMAPLVEKLVHEVVAPYAVSARVDYVRGVPPVVNEAAAIEILAAATTLAGAVGVATPQSLGGEDFAWMLTRAPGAMARLGTRTEGGRTHDLHQGDYAPDERAIGIGARLLALAALGVQPER